MDFRQQWKRKISRQKQLQKDEGEKTLEEKETKNKFWKGVLVGALVTAFAGFAVVGFATGIWIIGRRTSESQSAQTTGADANKLDMKKIEMINQAAADNFDGIIHSSNTIFFGECSDCIKKS